MQENNLGKLLCICNTRLQIHILCSEVRYSDVKMRPDLWNWQKCQKRDELKTSSYQRLSLATDLIFHNHQHLLQSQATSTTPISTIFIFFFLTFLLITKTSYFSLRLKIPIPLSIFFSLQPLCFLKSFVQISGFLNSHHIWQFFVVFSIVTTYVLGWLLNL